MFISKATERTFTLGGRQGPFGHGHQRHPQVPRRALRHARPSRHRRAFQAPPALCSTLHAPAPRSRPARCLRSLAPHPRPLPSQHNAVSRQPADLPPRPQPAAARRQPPQAGASSVRGPGGRTAGGPGRLGRLAAQRPAARRSAGGAGARAGAGAGAGAGAMAGAARTRVGADRRAARAGGAGHVTCASLPVAASLPLAPGRRAGPALLLGKSFGLRSTGRERPHFQSTTLRLLDDT